MNKNKYEQKMFKKKIWLIKKNELVNLKKKL
jgi:hypothetical protein